MKDNIRLFFIVCCCSFCSLLNSTTWIIDQSGGGNFTTIQEGIDASVDSDTVLVNPGTYFENIIYNGKNITEASLEMTTGNEAYIDSTIIDGQQQEVCVRVINHETSARIQGFTITNGKGTPVNYEVGGGILVEGPYADPVFFDITNCIITENHASGGAGIYLENGIINLSGTSIRNNYAYSCAGGIYIYDYSGITFSSSNLCSIYDNYAALGCDLYLYSLHIPNIDVIVDTFTVQNPSRYFAQYKCLGNNNPYTFNIQHHSLELVNHDIYIAPDGDDTNSGLTPNEPMKTINLAIRKIEPDSIFPKTVHLAEGVYIENRNFYQFPIGSKSYVNIVGENESTTIIDGENNYFFKYIFIDYGKENIIVKNITLQNIHCTWGAIGFTYCNNIVLENITLRYALSDQYGVIHGSTACENVKMINVKVLNTTSNRAYAGVSIYAKTKFEVYNSLFRNNSIEGFYAHHSGLFVSCDGDVIVENCVFDNNSVINMADTTGTSAFCQGPHNGETGEVFITNSVFSNNEAYLIHCTVTCNSLENITIANCTFVDNSSFYCLAVVGEVLISNTIMRNNSTYEIFIPDFTWLGIITTLNVEHSNIQNGQNAILNVNNANIVNWLEGNIDEEPLFFGTLEHPCQLSPFSPCVDAGTTDTTGLYLPPWDLLHNYRVWDGDNNGTAIIDMGCYEFGAEQYVGVENIQSSIFNIQLSNYPNPFNPTTTIKFNLPESGEVKLVIYNIKGQKVRELKIENLKLKINEVVWDGTDENNQPVSSGIYLYKLQLNDKTLAARKCLLLK